MDPSYPNPHPSTSYSNPPSFDDSSNPDFLHSSLLFKSKKLTQSMLKTPNEIIPGLKPSDPNIYEKYESFLNDIDNHEYSVRHQLIFEDKEREIEEILKDNTLQLSEEAKENLYQSLIEIYNQGQEFKQYLSPAHEDLSVSRSMMKNSSDDIAKLLKRSRLELSRIERLLPIYARKSDLIDKIANNKTLLITGENACGKTTQIPQYLLEVPNLQGSIACIQPNRSLAISVAN